MPQLKKFREFLRCNFLSVYPNLIRFIGVSPILANIRLTGRCSSMCETCTHWIKPDPQELESGQWKRIISTLKKAGYIGVSFTGGDIFLRDDIFELIQFTSDQGMRVNFTSNGYLIDETAAKTLMDLNISSILLSLDDMTIHFDTIRGLKGSADRVLSAISLLKKYHNPSTSLGLAVTVMKENLTPMKEVVQYGVQNDLQIRFNPIHFTHYFSDTEFSKNQYKLSPQGLEELSRTLRWLITLRSHYPKLLPKLVQIKWIHQYFLDYRQNNTPCYKPLLKPCIEPNGDLRPCCSMNPIANLTQHSLDEIISSDEYADIAFKGLLKECPGCSCHYALNLDSNIFYLMKEVMHRIGLLKFNMNDCLL